MKEHLLTISCALDLYERSTKELIENCVKCGHNASAELMNRELVKIREAQHAVWEVIGRTHKV